jgi:hypothetical protein
MHKMLRMNHRLTCNLQISRTGVRVGSIAAPAGACRDQAPTNIRPETFLCDSTLLRLLYSACRGTRETGILSRQQVI